MTTDPNNLPQHTQKLLTYATPQQLRKSVHRALFAYLMEQDQTGIDKDYKEIVENLYFLLDFLERLESETTKT
ncbi:hypothetical protein [Parvicella tangerina]|uniref:Uncharacterized protein n=1 Tax=Parvicella tangerina TaxID=2829795 RepID=A0A916JQB6_9FLAO|nr:hypothetical protein [Parvicella tangerina]CAG5087452.1 hypothetical protein CRYO30217_03486 [Parvicella tangerina]